MRRISLAISLTVLLVINLAITASAVTVDFTFTADNIVASWFRNGSTGYEELSLAGASNLEDWQTADTLSVDLNLGEIYEIIWLANNPDPPSPGALLAEISSRFLMSGASSPLSDSTWEVARYPVYPLPDDWGMDDWSSLVWGAATSYARNGDPDSPWYGGPGHPIEGISENAEWIWTELNFDDPGAPGPDDSVFIKAIVKVLTPLEAIDEVISIIKDMGLQKGIENSLVVKLEGAKAAIERGQQHVAIDILNAFINQLEAQKGKKLTEEQSDELAMYAENIISALGANAAPAKQRRLSSEGKLASIWGRIKAK